MLTEPKAGDAFKMGHKRSLIRKKKGIWIKRRWDCVSDLDNPTDEGKHTQCD